MIGRHGPLRNQLTYNWCQKSEKGNSERQWCHSEHYAAAEAPPTFCFTFSVSLSQRDLTRTRWWQTKEFPGLSKTQDSEVTFFLFWNLVKFHTFLSLEPKLYVMAAFKEFSDCSVFLDETWLSKLWKKLNFFFKVEFLKEINRIHNNNKQRMIKYGNK